jgi:hypothetical protein
LERRNIGEQFKVLDPATVPQQPYSPNRLLVIGGGAAGGLFVGLLFIGGLEFSDSSFKREEEIVRLCQVPVLAVVPIMMSAQERRRARRRTMAAIAIAVICLVASGVVLLIWRTNLGL